MNQSSLSNRHSATITATRSVDSTRTISTTATTVSSARLQLLQASLQHVPEYGWTKDAIRAGLMMKPPHSNQQVLDNNHEQIQQQQQQQLPLSMLGMITPTDLVEWFMKDSNQKFAKQLDAMKFDDADDHANRFTNHNTTMTKSTATTDVVSNMLYRAIRARLEYILPVGPKQWHMGMALGALENPHTTAKQVQEIVDLIVNKINHHNHNGIHHDPKSTTWTTTWQRTTIGAIYVATELHLLTDDSPQYEATWTFLRQRIEQCSSNSSIPVLPWSYSSSKHDNNNNMNINYGIMENANDSMVAISSVVTSLAGAVMSVAQAQSGGNYVLSSVLLPQFLSLTTWPSKGTASTTTATTPGTVPQDYYANLPPFPSVEKKEE